MKQVSKSVNQLVSQDVPIVDSKETSATMKAVDVNSRQMINRAEMYLKP